jgi:GT2 family glycosyltransferase
MTISVIIVSYNVRYFLAQCICSVQTALKDIMGEIIVIDNASTDGTAHQLPPLFPFIHWILNDENIGFAKANNQGMAIAKGKYVLCLNPDTLIPAHFFKELITFAEQQPQLGAVGVKMIDGAGYFLPESKRGFPTPAAALFKFCGLSSIFPKSPIFNQYALGHLSENEIQPIPILCGACMLLPKNVLRQTGPFDEAFFMYGEDIDLSYRIEQAGFTNYYYGALTIIHFKGESKPTYFWQHIQQFYGAMQVFVRKHYKGSRAFFMALILQFAILLSAVFALLTKPFRTHSNGIIDMGILIASNLFAFFFWKEVVHNGIPFNTFFVPYALVLYAVILWIILWLGGAYDKPYKSRITISAGILGMLVLLAFYALLPEGMRFSRGVVLLSGSLGILGIMLIRKIAQHFRWASYSAVVYPTAIAIGAHEEIVSLKTIWPQSVKPSQRFAILSPDDFIQTTLATWQQLPTQTLVLCWGKQLPLQPIIEKMQWVPGRFFYRFFHTALPAIIGSDTSAVKGAVFSEDKKYQLAYPAQKRMKRFVDICFSITFFCCIPVIIIAKGASAMALGKQAWQVLTGQKTWISYANNWPHLPALSPGILNTLGRNSLQPLTLPPTLIQKADEDYALQYEWQNDIIFMFQHLNALFKNS